MKARDHIVAAGDSVRKRPKHNNPWIYFYKVKSGRKKTGNVEKMHYNMTDLKGDAVKRHANKQEDFAVYGIVRVMRSHMRSRREDI